MSKIGVVLSGGGVKGIAHVAFLEKLKELGLEPSELSGSSAGALIGALYSSGVAMSEIIDFFESVPLFKMAWVARSKPGIFDSERYIELFEKYLPKTFEELNIPLFIAAVNLEKGRVDYFSEGELYPPLLASCAVPLVFSPVEINGCLYTDGGTMNNFPIEPLRERADIIFGSYVSKPKSRNKEALSSSLKIINHANSLLLHAANEYKFCEADLTIQYDLGNYGIFGSKKIREIYEVAITTMESYSPELSTYVQNDELIA